LLLVGGLLFGVLSLCAQQTAKATTSAQTASQALPPDAPSREQLLKLFKTLEIKQQMDAVRKTLHNSMEEQFSQSTMDLTPKQKSEIAKLESDLFDKFMDDDYINNAMDAMIPVYQRHFTSSDVETLLAFYSTAVGQKFLHEQPQILAEVMPKMMNDMQGKLQKEMDEIHFSERMMQIMSEGDHKKPAKQ